MYTQKDISDIPAYKIAVKNLENEMKLLEEKIEVIYNRKYIFEEKINDLESITEFYCGIPLQFFHHDDETYINAVPRNNRQIDIYEQHGDKYEVFYWNIGSGKGKQSLEKDFTSEKAIYVGKEWVAKGVLP